MRAGVAQGEAEGRELACDLGLCEGLGEGDVDVAPIVGVPFGQVGVDGSDAGDRAVDDVDHGFEARPSCLGDGEPFAVGFELGAFAGAGLPVSAVGVGIDLAGAGAAVDDEGAVWALAVGVQGPVESGAANVERGSNLRERCTSLSRTLSELGPAGSGRVRAGGP